MISRSTLLGALVVAELAIVGMGAKAIAGGDAYSPGPGHFGAGGFGHGLSGIGPGAAGSTPLDRSFIAGPAPRVVVDAHDVDVVVDGTSSTTVRVVETIRKVGYVAGDVPAVAAQQTPDGVRVSATGSTDTIVIGSFSHELRISVPPNARVEVTSAGHVDAAALRSKLIAHLAEGAIRIHDHRGDIDVSTGSGSIRMVGVEATEIAASTRDGRVYLTRVAADRIHASSASGRIVGADVRAVDGVLTTRDGRIILSFTGNSDATVNAHTADGKVHVSGFDVTENNDQRTIVRLGSGRGRFEVSTDNGPITITHGANV
jgi:delta 1-pyrroline-5-carboxylate dehydrogenase